MSETSETSEIEKSDYEQVEVPLTKPKRQKSAKQLEQFQTAVEKRKANIEKRKYDKKIESAKLLLEHEKKKPLKQEKPKPDPVISTDEEQSDSEPEIIVVAKKKKPKKKPIKIQIEESSSEEEELPKVLKEREFVSQRNKKSVIRQVPQNYFFD
jgi:hypothetical protein